MPLSRRTEPTHEAYAQAARETGDAAILVERVMPYSTSVSQGRDGGLRLRWWWRRSRSRNLGPRGGGHVSIGYAADTYLIDTGQRALAMDCQGKFPTFRGRADPDPRAGARRIQWSGQVPRLLVRPWKRGRDCSQGQSRCTNGAQRPQGDERVWQCCHALRRSGSAPVRVNVTEDRDWRCGRARWQARRRPASSRSPDSSRRSFRSGPSRLGWLSRRVARYRRPAPEKGAGHPPR